MKKKKKKRQEDPIYIYICILYLKAEAQYLLLLHSSSATSSPCHKVFLFSFFFFFLVSTSHIFFNQSHFLSLSTHHLPIKQTANVYTIIDFPIESKFLLFQQSILLSLSLSLTYHLLFKKTAFLPIKTFNCLPLDLKSTDLIFHIQILKVYLRSPNYNQNWKVYLR